MKLLTSVKISQLNTKKMVNCFNTNEVWLLKKQFTKRQNNDVNRTLITFSLKFKLFIRPSGQVMTSSMC